MRLVVDANVLVGEILRKAGRERIADERLDLVLAEHTLAEVRHEVPKRVRELARHRRLSPDDADELVGLCLRAIDDSTTVVHEAVYSPLEADARSRCPRDPDDWPLVALAMVLEVGVWTEDRDFLGTGVATWSVETLRRWLDRTGQVGG